MQNIFWKMFSTIEGKLFSVLYNVKIILYHFIFIKNYRTRLKNNNITLILQNK